MPSFNNIDNGESGLSVRNTLNEVIDFVNTGITSGFTYITEDTTPGSEFVNILSPRDVYISGGTSVELEYYGSPTITGYVLLDNTQTKLHFDDGSVTSQLDLNSGGFINLGMSQGTDFSNIDLQVTDINLQVDDGTNTSTETITPSQTQLITTELSTGNFSELTFQSDVINFYVGDTGQTIFNQFSFDPSSSIQLISTDGTDNTMIELTPTTITSSVTDGTFTNTSSIDSDRTLFQITDNTINLEADFDANNGLNLFHSDGTNSASFGLDAFTATATLASSDGTNSSEIETFGDGTINITSTDGTNTTTQTIIPSQISSSVTDGTNISDITNSSNQLFFSSTDGTINSNFSLTAPAFGINVGNGTNSGVSSFEASLISNNINNGTTLDNHRLEITDTELKISSFDNTLTSGSSVTTDLTKVELFSSDGITTSEVLIQNDKIRLIVNNDKPVIIQSVENYRTITTTTNATPTTVLTIPFGTTQALQNSGNINCKVKCNNVAITSGYTANLFAGFIFDGTTVTQLSTTDKLEKSTLVGVTSNISFTGTDLIISVTGLAATNLNWIVNVEIQ